MRDNCFNIIYRYLNPGVVVAHDVGARIQQAYMLKKGTRDGDVDWFTLLDSFWGCFVINIEVGNMFFNII